MFWSQKEPPLHQAVIENAPESVAKLLKQKIDLDTVNALGFTALEIAQFLGLEKIISLLTPAHTNHIIKITFPEVPEPIECSNRDLRAILGVTYRPYLHFASYQFFKETVNQCPWILKWISNNRENQKLYESFYPNIKRGDVADTEIKWIDREKGLGLFAHVDFPANFYIGEYTGEVRQLHRLKPDHNGYCFHYPTKWWSWKYLMVDALRSGNELRFMNHSDFPNLNPCCLVDRGLLHLFFVTNREIKAGEELTFNYGPDYWQMRDKFA